MKGEFKKPLRLPLGPRISEKRYMTEEEARKLFSRKLIAEEKMDGTFCRIELPGYVVFAEDLKYRKTVPYRVPARYAVFDVLDKRTGFFLPRDEKEGFVEAFELGMIERGDFEGNFFIVPLVGRGKFELEAVPELVKISVYGENEAYMEGLVFKEDRPIHVLENDIYSGKFVRQEFLEKIAASDEKITGSNVINPRIPKKARY